MNSKDYADRLASVLAKYPHASYVAVIEALEDALDHDGTIYVCGNGGSSATASHMVADFANLLGFPIVCLSDNVPRLTAEANDRDYDGAFTAALRPYLKKEDALVVFSGSGNSRNIVDVLLYAQPLCTTIALLGMGGGQAKTIAGVSLVVPSDDMQLIEDVHLTTVHMLTQYFQNK